MRTGVSSLPLQCGRELCRRDAPVFSCGWHPEQLSAAEYNGFICRNVSANLDMMCEARSRPRPGLLHPNAATDEKADVGLPGDMVEEEYMAMRYSGRGGC